jgi:hypothetical protein
MDKQATQEAEDFFRLITTGGEVEPSPSIDGETLVTASNVVNLAEYRRLRKQAGSKPAR